MLALCLRLPPISSGVIGNDIFSISWDCPETICVAMVCLALEVDPSNGRGLEVPPAVLRQARHT